MTHLMNADGVWEASEKTLILIVRLHEEVKVFLWLQRGKKYTGRQKQFNLMEERGKKVANRSES